MKQKKQHSLLQHILTEVSHFTEFQQSHTLLKWTAGLRQTIFLSAIVKMFQVFGCLIAPKIQSAPIFVVKTRQLTQSVISFNGQLQAESTKQEAKVEKIEAS